MEHVPGWDTFFPFRNRILNLAVVYLRYFCIIRANIYICKGKQASTSLVVSSSIIPVPKRPRFSILRINEEIISSTILVSLSFFVHFFFSRVSRRKRLNPTWIEWILTSNWILLNECLNRASALLRKENSLRTNSIKNNCIQRCPRYFADFSGQSLRNRGQSGLVSSSFDHPTMNSLITLPTDNSPSSRMEGSLFSRFCRHKGEGEVIVY